MPRRARRHRYELNADVNVVSLIDVMLLLLVIFMITAPMMQGGIDISLPQAQSKAIESKGELSVSVNRAGQVMIGDQGPYTVRDFGVLFPSIAQNRTANGVYLRADKSVDYGTIAQLLAIMNAHGVTNIGLVTEPEVVR